MPRAAMMPLLLVLLAASSAASAQARSGTPAAHRNGAVDATQPSAMTSKSLALGGIAAALLLAPEVQAALQAQPDVVPAVANLATATAQEWGRTAQGAAAAAWEGVVAAWTGTAEATGPAWEQAEALLQKASAYARAHPEYAAASAAAGTAGSAAAGIAGRVAKWTVGVGLVTAGFAAAGWLDPESARLAAEQAFGATSDTARQALEALRHAPWYERAATEAGAFCSRWGRHALEHPGMTATFAGAGWAIGPKLLALPFRLLSGRSKH